MQQSEWWTVFVFSVCRTLQNKFIVIWISKKVLVIEFRISDRKGPR